MKIKLTRQEVQPLITEAEEGSGREVEIGGENFQIDMTILPGDITGRPELNGGTLRVILNKRHKYIGHVVLK